MLNEFLTENRAELIRRCKAKVEKRHEAHHVPAVLTHGIPLFLQQLAETLRIEQTTPHPEHEAAPTPAPTEIGRAAALHGAQLLALGYSIDQVVHGYGDLCQAITAMAVEQEYGITTDEFRTLNRCLDDAIADAVTSFGTARQVSVDAQTVSLQQRLAVFADEQRRLVDISLQALAAVRTGNVGLTGATGTLLQFALTELGSLAERSLPEIRIATPAADPMRH